MSAYDLRNWYVGRGALPPEVQKARTKEIQRRINRALDRARIELAQIHDGTFRRLYRGHLDRIYDECGPLPGDDQ